VGSTLEYWLHLDKNNNPNNLIAQAQVTKTPVLIVVLELELPTLIFCRHKLQ
ncbi:hypothetical protein V496_06436, partial [Pseudogymnoascus sp. VKM F-4515 (FW-2607)]